MAFAAVSVVAAGQSSTPRLERHPEHGYVVVFDGASDPARDSRTSVPEFHDQTVDSKPPTLVLRSGEFAAERHGPGCEVDGVPTVFAARSRRPEGGWWLVPRRPLRSGRDYTACVEYPGRGRLERRVVGFQVPSDEVDGLVGPPSPVVVDAWPGVLGGAEETDARSPEVVPANLLRIYVWFDQPMWPAEVARHLDLLDGSGEVIADALVPIPEGLWDAQRRRLTVFLHPGRIKRGVGPRRVEGAAIESGQEVTLRILPGLRSMAGIRLQREGRVVLRVGAADRRSPDPRHWLVERPGRPDEALRVRFDERLDREVVRRLVRVAHEDEAVEGVVEVAEDGKSLRFVPREPWRPGFHELLVSGRVEDLAGNSVDRLFDLDTGALPDADVEVVEPSNSGWLRLPFLVD